jgi:predicted nucleic-acid-binding protein
MIFVDTNVFVRLFAKDDAFQHEQARDLFLKAQAGKVELVTGHPVFFELAWVLNYTYKMPNAEIMDKFEAILSFGGLKISERELIAEAIRLARETKSSFADSYIAVSMRRLQAGEIATFNVKHFAKLGAELYPLESKGKKALTSSNG